MGCASRSPLRIYWLRRACRRRCDTRYQLKPPRMQFCTASRFGEHRTAHAHTIRRPVFALGLAFLRDNRYENERTVAVAGCS